MARELPPVRDKFTMSGKGQGAPYEIKNNPAAVGFFLGGELNSYNGESMYAQGVTCAACPLIPLSYNVTRARIP